MRYLGVDYGKRKIGLALSEGFGASALAVLEVGGLKDAVEKVKAVVRREGIGKVVVGVAESGESRKMAEKFIKELEYTTVVVGVDETLSSKKAWQKMAELGVAKKKRAREDSFAAAVLLDEYLECKDEAK